MCSLCATLHVGFFPYRETPVGYSETFSVMQLSFRTKLCMNINILKLMCTWRYDRYDQNSTSRKPFFHYVIGHLFIGGLAWRPIGSGRPRYNYMRQLLRAPAETGRTSETPDLMEGVVEVWEGIGRWPLDPNKKSASNDLDAHKQAVLSREIHATRIKSVLSGFLHSMHVQTTPFHCQISPTAPDCIGQEAPNSVPTAILRGEQPFTFVTVTRG